MIVFPFPPLATSSPDFTDLFYLRERMAEEGKGYARRRKSKGQKRVGRIRNVSLWFDTENLVMNIRL